MSSRMTGSHDTGQFKKFMVMTPVNYVTTCTLQEDSLYVQCKEYLMFCLCYHSPVSKCKDIAVLQAMLLEKLTLRLPT